jgi:nitrogen fixation-related uncharacterized protein
MIAGSPMILLLIAIVVAVPLLVGVAAQLWGADSRDFAIDPRYPRGIEPR